MTVSTNLSEGARPLIFILAERELSYSRDNVTFTGADVVAGQVVGKVSLAGATATAKSGGNTGNGAFTLDSTHPVRVGAKPGIYTARVIAAASNAGTVRVSDPDGYVLGDVAVGGTFDNDIKFVMADGATDWIVGDGFDITVAAGSGKVKAFDPTAEDGSQIPCGIACYPYKPTTQAQDVPGVILARAAAVKGVELTWPGGITGPQKSAAVLALAGLGIVIR